MQREVRSFLIATYLFIQAPGFSFRFPFQEHMSALQRKAEGGDVGAELELARAYNNGKGVPQDYAEAAKWFRKAAEHGSAEAQDSLGVIYIAGDGVERDKAEALKWYQKAAQQGYAKAWYHLGTVYYNGDGVEISDVKAYAWFLLAKDAGDKNASDAVAWHEAELTAETRLQGMMEIGRLYDQGEVLPKSEAEAMRWWLMAAEDGHQEARMLIASRYLNGQGVTQDFEKAKYWCTKAAKGDTAGRAYDPRAAYCLAVIYQRGLGVNKNLPLAREWLERAASAGHLVAAQQFAAMCANGEGGKPDRVRAALIYFQIATRSKKEGLPPLLELKKRMDGKEWAAFQKALAGKHIDTSQLPELFEGSPPTR